MFCIWRFGRSCKGRIVSGCVFGSGGFFIGLCWVVFVRVGWLRMVFVRFRSFG